MFGIPTVLERGTVTFLLLRIVLRAGLAAAVRVEGTPAPRAMHRSQAQQRVFLLASFLGGWTASTRVALGLTLHHAYPATASLAFGAWFCQVMMIRRENGEPLPLRPALARLPWRGLGFIALGITVSLSATRDRRPLGGAAL